jgi:transcriptional regulator with XRE-family HTH domain
VEPSERLLIYIERAAEGYKASCEEKGVYVVASTFEELKGDINQALNQIRSVAENTPSLVGIKYVYDLPSFFDTHKVINAAALAKRIGISKSLLSQYVRGDKKPSEIQIRRILAGIRNVGEELAAIEFSS